MAPRHDEPNAVPGGSNHDSPDGLNDGANESELLARLAALPVLAPDRTASERIHRRTRAAFVRAHERASHPWLALLARAYTRVEPVMAAGVAVVYLNWAFQSVIALYN